MIHNYSKKIVLLLGVPNKYPNETVERELKTLLKEGSTHEVTIIKEECRGVVTAYFHRLAETVQQMGLPPIKLPPINK